MSHHSNTEPASLHDHRRFIAIEINSFMLLKVLNECELYCSYVYRLLPNDKGKDRKSAQLEAGYSFFLSY